MRGTLLQMATAFLPASMLRAEINSDDICLDEYVSYQFAC